MPGANRVERLQVERLDLARGAAMAVERHGSDLALALRARRRGRQRLGDRMGVGLVDHAGGHDLIDHAGGHDWRGQANVVGDPIGRLAEHGRERIDRLGLREAEDM